MYLVWAIQQNTKTDPHTTQLYKATNIESYPVLGNGVSGPEIGVPGRISGGLQSGGPQNRSSGRPGPILLLVRLEPGRKQFRKPHFRPGGTVKGISGPRV